MAAQMRDSNSKWHWGQRKQISVKITGKKKEEPNSDKQELDRRLQQRKVGAKSPTKKVGSAETSRGGGTSSRFRSRCRYQTSLIGKGRNDLTALKATAAREVYVCDWRGIRPAASRLPTSGTGEYGRVHRSQHNCH